MNDVILKIDKPKEITFNNLVLTDGEKKFLEYVEEAVQKMTEDYIKLQDGLLKEIVIKYKEVKNENDTLE